MSFYQLCRCQVRREADMQIREAEHRHRAELAAEQERVREAHDMVALVQFGAWNGGFR